MQFPFNLLELDHRIASKSITLKDQLLDISLDGQTYGPNAPLHYKLTGIFSLSGKKSIVLQAIDLDTDERVAIKIPKRHLLTGPSLKQTINQGRSEADLWSRLSKCEDLKKHVPEFRGIGWLKSVDGSICPCVIQNYIDGPSLSEWCNNTPKYRGRKDTWPWANIERGSSHLNERGHGGCQDLCDFFHLAWELVHVLKLLHGERIVHGDIWPPNILMLGNSRCWWPVFIDFGESWRHDGAFGQPGLKQKLYPYFAPEHHHSGGQSWHVSADLYSICGVLYFLATGFAPPWTLQINAKTRRPTKKAEPRKKTDIKAEILQGLRIGMQVSGITEVQLNCISDIILAGLRPIPHERIASADDLLQLIWQFGPKQGFRTPAEKKKPYCSGKRDKTGCILDGNTAYDRFQGRLRLAWKSFASQSGFHLRGHRDDYIMAFTSCLSGMEQGDELFGLTAPTFWYRQNLGPNGRALASLRGIIHRNTTVRWVLFCDENEWASEDVQEILWWQRELLLGAKSESINVIADPSDAMWKTKDGQPDAPSSGVYLGYRLVSSEDRQELVRMSRTFVALMEKRPSKCGDRAPTWYAPIYTKDKGPFASVRIWRDEARWKNELEGELLKSICKSKSIEGYLATDEYFRLLLRRMYTALVRRRKEWLKVENGALVDSGFVKDANGYQVRLVELPCDLIVRIRITPIVKHRIGTPLSLQAYISPNYCKNMPLVEEIITYSLGGKEKGLMLPISFLHV